MINRYEFIDKLIWSFLGLSIVLVFSIALLYKDKVLSMFSIYYSIVYRSLSVLGIIVVLWLLVMLILKEL